MSLPVSPSSPVLFKDSQDSQDSSPAESCGIGPTTIPSFEDEVVHSLPEYLCASPDRSLCSSISSAGSLILHELYPSEVVPEDEVVPETEDVTESEVVPDETDGPILALLLNTVKSVVVHLLTVVLRKYRNEICYGCQINHPSQKHHECLDELPQYFYLTHFDAMNTRLWTDRFIPSILRALEKRALPMSVSEHRIQGLCEAFLHDLKFSKRIDDKIGKLFFRLTGGEVGKIKAMTAAAEYWAGETE